MPYKSQAQRRWAHTEAGKKALGGESAVHEWDEATKGKKLPEKVGKGEELQKGTSIPSTSIPNPAKVGSTAVKMPKTKKMADPFGKPSLFFKKEDFDGIKQPSIEKLRIFLEKTRSRKQSSS